MSIQSELSQASLNEQKPSFLPNADTLKKLLIPLAILLAALFYLSSVSDPSIFLIGVMGVVVIVPAGILVWNHPELSLLALIFLESDIIRPDELLDVRLSGGGLDLRDIALLGTLGVTFVQELINQRIRFKLFPVGGLLLLFLVLTTFSLVNALVFEKAAFNWAFNDFRIMLYFTLFFSVTWGIHTKQQLKTLFVGLFSMANILVVMMIIQQFLGIDDLLTTGMERWQISEEPGGVLRILPPLILLIALLLVISICFAYFTNDRKFRLLALGQFSFLLIGFLLTYTRSAWLTVLSAIFIVLLHIAYKHRKEAAAVLALLSPLLIGTVFLLASTPSAAYSGVPLIGPVLERAASIFEVEDTSQSDSLQWRFFENSEAIRSIKENPIFGVGLGNQYREITIIQGEAAGDRTTDDITRLTRYIHNSFLSMAAKMGIPTLALFLITYIVFIGMAWHLHTQIEDPLFKSIALGVSVTFIPCLLWAQFFSLYTESNHITSVAVFMGLVAVIAEWKQDRSSNLSEYAAS